MTIAVHTPIELSGATKTGPRTWRKQVLPIGTINYGARKLNFDRQYCADVAQAFRDGAFDTVPFVLADESNRHTMKAENGAHGEVLALEDDDAGLWATVRLSETAEQIVEANPRFGVSMRLFENYERPDGKRWPRAAQHVLGTWDPKVAGLAPWSSVELSNSPGTAVVDLTGLTYETKEEATMADNSSTDTETPAWFQALIDNGSITVNTPTLGKPADTADTAADTAEDVVDGPSDEDLQGMSDAEFDAWLAAQMADVEATDHDDDTDETAEADADALVEASNRAGAADVALSNAAADERFRALELSNATMARQLDEARYDRELAELAAETGLPPATIDLARDLLIGDGVIELSNGAAVDAGDIVRNVLRQIGEHVQVLDLSAQFGQLAPPSEEKENVERRAAIAKQFLADNGIG